MSLIENALRPVLRPVLRPIRRFVEDARAAITVELVLVLPMLLWAFFATMIFNDAYRSRTQAQAAALHVADAISRNTTILTTQYLEGMNDVYDFLTGGEQMSRLRITSVVWDRDADQPLVLWSYGTRGMTALPDNAFQLMAADEFGTLRELMDGEDGENMLAGHTQMPNTDLHNRIPPVMPGEALILVESFTMWEAPVQGVFLGFDILENTRLSPIAVVRPRFTPFINFEGAIDAVPPDHSEFNGAPGDTTSDPADPEDTAPPEIDATVVTVINNDFSTSPPAGVSDPEMASSNYAGVGNYLGPFGKETGDNPLTIPVNFGQSTIKAMIEIDFLVFDEWVGYDDKDAPDEGEYIMVQINGSSIALKAFEEKAEDYYDNSTTTVVRRSDGIFTTSFELIERDVKIGGEKKDEDQLWRLRIHAHEPNQFLNLGFSMVSDQKTKDASFGLASIKVEIVPGHHQPDRFMPSQNTANVHHYTSFQNYRGCNDHSLGGVTHTVSGSELREMNKDTLRYRVRAGGNTNLDTCPGLPSISEGYINANPNIVLNWTNDGNNPSRNLIIQTDDGKKGEKCDAVLLIRDPNGQYFYNGWIKWEGKKDDDWNARVNLANAPSGQYHVWIGQWYSNYCETDIEIRYN